MGGQALGARGGIEVNFWVWVAAAVVGLLALLGAVLFWGAANAPSDEELLAEFEERLCDGKVSEDEYYGHRPN